MLLRIRINLILVHLLHHNLVLGWTTLSGDRPLFFGHQGESFYMPESTVPGFKLAVYEYADAVDTDIVLTADGIPVCHHGLGLKDSTDVANHPEFAHLKGTYVLPALFNKPTQTEDWMIFNFTLSQLKSLRMNQKAIGVRPQDFNGLFGIPTLSQFIETVASASLQVNRTIGLTLELKSPELHNSLFPGMSHYMERVVLECFRKAGFPLGQRASCSAQDTRLSPWDPLETPFGLLNINPGSGSGPKPRVPIPCGEVIIQSLEAESLKFIGAWTKRPPGLGLMQLILFDVSLLTPGGFLEMRRYVDSVGIFKEYLTTGPISGAVLSELVNPSNISPSLILARGGLLSAQEIVPLAHSLGLLLGTYTFHDSRENSLFFCGLGCSPRNRKRELFYHFSQGVDILWVDNIPEATNIGLQYIHEVLTPRMHPFFSTALYFANS